MECYNCGAQLGTEDNCLKCGAEVKIYKKIIKASNSLYNEGLEKAEVRDLTGAISCLKKCLQLNKMHTDARNLLGLVYFEMGETVSALTEWVISKNYQRRNNAADGYLGEIQNNPSKLDAINQTIKKYNQALLYCRQDSKDLAIIQLKKVLALNPKLVRGQQLLGLLYMQDGRYEQAKKILRGAAKIDENNTTTLRYLREVDYKMRANNPKKQKNDDLVSYQSGNDTVIMPAHFKDTTAMQTIINIIIGIALGIAIAVFLILPNIKQQAKSDANNALKSANDTLSTKEQSISSLEKKVESLTEEVEQAKKDVSGQESKMQSYDMLLSAYASYSAEDMDAAGSAMQEVKVEDLSESAKAIYNDMNAKVNEKYLTSAYQEGYSAYNKGKIQDAITSLQKVVEMDEEYQNGNAVYYLAQAYRRNNDMANAVIYYKKIMEKYPGTERARVSTNYVNSYEASGGTTAAADDNNTTGGENNTPQGETNPEGEQQPEGGETPQ